MSHEEITVTFIDDELGISVDESLVNDSNGSYCRVCGYCYVIACFGSSMYSVCDAGKHDECTNPIDAKYAGVKK